MNRMLTQPRLFERAVSMVITAALLAVGGALVALMAAGKVKHPFQRCFVLHNGWSTRSMSSENIEIAKRAQENGLSGRALILDLMHVSS